MQTSPDVYDKTVILLKLAFIAAAGQFAAFTIGPKAVIAGLVFFMAIDWITGLAAAWMHGEVRSDVGRKGLARKGLTLLLILTINLAEKLCGYDLSLASWGAAGYCVNEFISIVENMDRAGVWIPQALVDGLQKVKGLGPKRATRAEIDALRDENRTAADTQLTAARAEADTSREDSRKEIDALKSDKLGN